MLRKSAPILDAHLCSLTHVMSDLAAVHASMGRAQCCLAAADEPGCGLLPAANRQLRPRPWPPRIAHTELHTCAAQITSADTFSGAHTSNLSQTAFCSVQSTCAMWTLGSSLKASPSSPQVSARRLQCPTSTSTCLLCELRSVVLCQRWAV